MHIIRVYVQISLSTRCDVPERSRKTGLHSISSRESRVKRSQIEIDVGPGTGDSLSDTTFRRHDRTYIPTAHMYTLHVVSARIAAEWRPRPGTGSYECFMGRAPSAVLPVGSHVRFRHSIRNIERYGANGRILQRRRKRFLSRDL